MAQQLLTDWHVSGFLKYLPNSVVFETIMKHWSHEEHIKPIDSELRTKSQQDFAAVLAPLFDKLLTVSFFRFIRELRVIIQSSVTGQDLDAFSQWASRVRADVMVGWRSAGTDKLWAAAMCCDRVLKPLVDIALRNTPGHHMKYVVIEPAGVDPITNCHELLVSEMQRQKDHARICSGHPPTTHY
jgi:hypothetical protein